MKNQATKYNSTLLLVGVLFIIWGILGLMDAKNYTYSGYSTDGNFTVFEIIEGSPADEAGMMVGDVIVSSGGIAITNTKELSKRERVKIGETRDYVVNRNGEEHTLMLTFAAMTNKNNTLNRVSFIIGLLFILLGAYAHFKIKSTLTFSFALFTLCFGFIFFNGPYIGTGTLNQIINSLSSTVVMFSFATLAHYMLKYPPQSNFLNSKKNTLWIYVPAGMLVAIVWILNFTQPDSTSSLNNSMRMLFGAFIIFYFGLALVTLFKKYLNSDAVKRKSSGLGLMLYGAVIGLLPILIYFTISTISPKTILPFDDYVFLTFVAIPIFFTLALLQLNRT